MLDSFTFTLDSSGNITQVLHADNTKWVYTYHQRHRVTEGDLKDSGNSNMRVHTYTYDAANNTTAKTRVITSPYSSSSWTYGYNDANEQTSVNPYGGTTETRTYDAWGRTATRTRPGTAKAGTDPSALCPPQRARSAWVSPRFCYGGRLYNYATNFAGESAETMQYRGDGRLFSRVSGETTTVYRYDRGWNAINQEDESGGLSGSSVYAPGAEVGERLAHAWGPLSDTVMAHAYHDQLGSTRAWRWQNKNLIGRNSFAPYGELVSSNAVAPIDYALHVRDPYTLCFHAPYREYAAGSARWTTRDPLGMVDGPNMYAYVTDRPVDSHDPDGLSLECCLKAGQKAFDEAFAKYNGGGQRTWTDHMRHCTASCELTKSQGHGCASLADLREDAGRIFPKSWRGRYISDGDPFDYESNAMGRDCGSSYGGTNCDACCRQKWRDRVINRDRLPD